MKKHFLFLLLAFMVPDLNAGNPWKGEKCIIKTEFIYQQEDVPFPSCHASTIIQNGKGLMAAWFGGTAEKNPDVGIWVSLFKNDKWSIPVEAANGIQYKGKRYPCWNPVLYNTGKKVMLFFKVGPSPSEWWGELMTSDDNGRSWTKPCRLPEDIYGPVKNKPVKLQNGTLLCPSSTEFEGWRLHMEMTADEGATWERTVALNKKETGTGLIQPSVLLLPQGKLQLLCRSRSGFVMTAFSNDNGYNWTEAVPTHLPNPNSGIDAVTLSDGRHIVVYNHINKGRNMLNVAVSEDGMAWKAAALLENDERSAEYSYPAVIQSSDGLVHITYTWKRKLVKHVVLDPSKITAHDFVNGAWPGE